MRLLDQLECKDTGKRFAQIARINESAANAPEEFEVEYKVTLTLGRTIRVGGLYDPNKVEAAKRRIRIEVGREVYRDLKDYVYHAILPEDMSPQLRVKIYNLIDKMQ